MRTRLSGRACLLILAGSAIQAFGLYHVHACSGVTEGGVLGLTLLLERWFEISPALSGAILNMICYFVGWRVLGGGFIFYSLISTAGFCSTYWICEQFPQLWPELYQMPFLAAIIGALFIGIGVGICVRQGAAPGGDDALAMCISHATGWKIQWAYLTSDLVVILLSATYMGLFRLICSLATVMLSGQIIGLVQQFPLEKMIMRKKA